MYATYRNVAVRAITAAAPAHVTNNVDYAATVSDKKLRRRILYTGIGERHTLTGGQRPSDLATIAAEAALNALGWARDSIVALILVTQAPDLITPSTAKLIQAKLGLGLGVLAFDINLGCSGFTSGVQVMAGILSQTKGRGLLLVADGRIHKPGTEFASDSMLFGAGGGVAAMEYDESAPPMLCSQMTDGSRFKALYSSREHGRFMDGNEILLFSLNEVVDSINEFHDHYGITREEIDYYALHQAQKIIVEGIAQNCRLPSEKVLRSYPGYGNTSSASIPFAMCANADRLQRDGMKVFTCGYGIGLAWSSALLTLDKGVVLPLIESDYKYPTMF